MYPDYGCWTWFAPNSLADEWLSKIKLEKTIWNDRPAYHIKGLPCWTYSWDRMGGMYKFEPNEGMTTFNDKGCWYGICTQHAIVHTAILQERTKGGWTNIDGVPLRAIMIGKKGHWTMEVYIKDEGYFILDVMGHNFLYQWKPVKGITMMNRHLCTGAYTEDSTYGAVPYNSEWAGPGTRLQLTHINATSSPSGARIWLKKY